MTIAPRPATSPPSLSSGVCLRLLAALVGAALLAAGPIADAASAAASKARLDPSNPEDAVKLHQKLWCSLEDGKPAMLWSQGSVYARIPGEQDRKLLDFQIWNARACRSLNDPKRGYGYRSVSREIMIYLDPQTGQMLRQWRNPFTGETVNVVHTQNDPVNMALPGMFARDAEGKPYRFEATFANGRVIWSNEAPLFYDNPLGGSFQEYVGGRYHAMEMLNVFVYESDLLDPNVKTIARWSRSWRRMSSWLPWMRMGDRPGALVFTAVGQRVQSVDQLPEPIRSALRTEFSKYQTPPPLDDARPNETSWTYFRRIFEQEKQQARGVTPAATSTESQSASSSTTSPMAAAGRDAEASVPSRAVAGPPWTPVSAAEAATRFEQDLARDCSRDPARPELTTWWRGRVYSRRGGEKDRHLFDLRRTRVSRCEMLQDATRGRGYRLTARETIDYFPAGSVIPAATGEGAAAGATVSTAANAPAGTEPMRSWTNPWTSESVEVVGVRLDDAPATERWERDEQGQPSRGPTRFVLTDKLLIGSDADAQFTSNPLGGEYQDFIGGQLQILNSRTSETPLRLLARGASPNARDTVVSWGQVTPWLPWMKMGSREGVLVIHAAGMQEAQARSSP